MKPSLSRSTPAKPYPCDSNLTRSREERRERGAPEDSNVGSHSPDGDWPEIRPGWPFSANSAAPREPRPLPNRTDAPKSRYLSYASPGCWVIASSADTTYSGKPSTRRSCGTGIRRHPLPRFASSSFSCGNSTSAPLRLCARSSSFRSAEGTGTSRAEALGRRGRDRRHRRLLRGLAALWLCPSCLSMKVSDGFLTPASLKTQRHQEARTERSEASTLPLCVFA